MRTLILLSLILCIGTSCQENYEDVLPPLPLQGQAGNPRFNLVFDNEFNTDIDLHVETPLGEHIYFGNTYSNSGGTLDVDCICFCPDENIFFPLDGSAPKGTYKYWVNFYEACSTGAVSKFTIRVLERNRIVAVKEGTLTSVGENSTVWEYIYE